MDALKPQRNEPARMEKLAKLPVFWGLEGKRVVLAGGSDGAAWKAELLLACGAELHVFCERGDLSETFAGLVVRSTRLHFHAMRWHSGIFANAELALADCETDTEAAAFHAAARAAGVPVNVIDKPEFCQFQFGSIVNRSPVVVSISTDGAAPILAQAIRRRIETLLPPSLRDWGALARTIRERVNLRLTPGPSRRLFWEKFVDRAFTERLDEESEERLLMATGMQACEVGG
ncbi:uroporphyrinogen-III C-methyltransferase, partial [Agrobacterium sp. S2]|nr:uroporphyrinogen-III C-methyltransferase [Agrobacterium sp. S2]